MKAFWIKLSRWLRFNLFYVGRPPWDTGVSPPELIDFIEITEPGRALDLGCGTGTNLKTMAKAGWQVVGIDMAWLSVLKARAKLRRNGVGGRVIYGDVAGDPDVKPPFELILDIGCFHSLCLSERENYRENIKAWLSPKGTLLMYAHQRTSEEDPHGIVESDLVAFESFLDLQWRDDGDEVRPDGGGGYMATWVRFDRGSKG